jgi:septum formation protein
MLVLASQSPRRAELLRQLQVDFSTLPTDIDESIHPNEKPIDYVQRLSQQKALAGRSLSPPEAVVLGSDTSVVIDDTILGKPQDEQDCKRMLKRLSNRQHQVITAVSLINLNQTLTRVVITLVTFKKLSDKEIDWYWRTGEPKDKAGSYGIQGLGGQFVTNIKGSYSAVVGLPLYETSVLLQEMGVDRNEC